MTDSTITHATEVTAFGRTFAAMNGDTVQVIDGILHLNGHSVKEMAGADVIPTAVTEREITALQERASGVRVLEVGSLLGFSTIHLARVAKHVVAVDPHEGYPVHDPRPTLAPFLTNLERAGVREHVTPLIGRDDVLDCLAPQQFGLAFVDTTGEYDDTLRIARRAVPLIAQGGTLGIHDCGHPDWPGALDAAHTFAAETRIPFTLVDRLALFCISPQGSKR